MKVKGGSVRLRREAVQAAAASPDRRLLLAVEEEHRCGDPKDGELCLCRVKRRETVLEARSDADVQIARQIWV